jgi:hypothetical protein
MLVYDGSEGVVVVGEGFCLFGEFLGEVGEEGGLFLGVLLEEFVVDLVVVFL